MIVQHPRRLHLRPMLHGDRGGHPGATARLRNTPEIHTNTDTLEIDSNTTVS